MGCYGEAKNVLSCILFSSEIAFNETLTYFRSSDFGRVTEGDCHEDDKMQNRLCNCVSIRVIKIGSLELECFYRSYSTIHSLPTLKLLS